MGGENDGRLDEVRWGNLTDSGPPRKVRRWNLETTAMSLYFATLETTNEADPTELQRGMTNACALKGGGS